MLVLEPGERYSLRENDKEAAVLLLEGDVAYAWNSETRAASRPDSFRCNPWCLHVCRRTPVVITAKTHAELYIQAVVNEKIFSPAFYTPDDVAVQHAGNNGELMGCMRREIKTLFDYDNAPYSNMVLGEVLNYPGKWSSYPPHAHPQPEVYLHRFDKPQGFGASYANGEIYQSGHNGLTVILSGFHSQAAAPGYAMMYVWGIRHLAGNPWEKTRIDVPEHAWLWEKNTNQHLIGNQEE